MLGLAFHLMLIGAVFACVVMLVFWLVQVITKNAGVVHIGWALGLLLITFVYYSLGPGESLRRMMALFMVLVWSGRLMMVLFSRLLLDATEDRRYQKIRRDWQPHLQRKLLVLFLGQGLADVILSIPFLVVCLNPAPSIIAVEWLGFGIWLVGLTGETLADWQLKKFKRDPRNKGEVCQTGLWNWSRHPNYFFEWVIWIGFAVFALGSSWGWLGFISPVLMLHFLLNVTGIPPAEEQSLASRGDKYRAYQRVTSIFLPLLKKNT